MTIEQLFQILSWVLGALGAVFIFLFGIWWKIEARQDKKIDTLIAVNGKEHRDLYRTMDQQHHAIRDKLDNIWKHISKHDKTDETG